MSKSTIEHWDKRFHWTEKSKKEPARLGVQGKDCAFQVRLKCSTGFNRQAWHVWGAKDSQSGWGTVIKREEERNQAVKDLVTPNRTSSYFLIFLSSMDSFEKYLLSIYYIPDTMLDVT